jgi:hypothetical protein
MKGPGQLVRVEECIAGSRVTVAGLPHATWVDNRPVFAKCHRFRERGQQRLTALVFLVKLE